MVKRKNDHKTVPTNSNPLLPNTASNDIQQHVHSANSGDVDIRNLTITLIRTVHYVHVVGCHLKLC
jgi:hypothetical protein